MKKIFILIAIMFSTTICSNIHAQQAPPPGAGDKNLGDTNIKQRSIELERVDRDAQKENSKSKSKSAVITETTTSPEDKLAAKYDEIKVDYEQIQMSQDSVIKTYQGSGKIDYGQISKSAQEINRSAMRLNLNLFPAPIENPDAQKVVNPEAKIDEKKEIDTKTAKSVRDLIVDLDTVIGSFATSTMFQNLRTVDAAVSDKAKIDLGKIIELSAMLDAESQKSATSGK